MPPLASEDTETNAIDVEVSEHILRVSLSDGRVIFQLARNALRVAFLHYPHIAGAHMDYKVPLILAPQPEGGYRVTSPLLPELLTEGDTLNEALANVNDALVAVVELYDDMGRPLPQSLRLPKTQAPIWLETVVTVP